MSDLKPCPLSRADLLDKIAELELIISTAQIALLTDLARTKPLYVIKSVRQALKLGCEE